jgi:V/A-type H+-transporting ATPase subunit I
MEKLFLVGSKRLTHEILLDLQQAGMVQIDTLRHEEISEYRLNDEEKMRLKKWDEVMLRSDHSLRLLGLEADPSAEPFEGGLEEAESAVLRVELRAASLVERRDRLEEELDLIDQYYEVVSLLTEMVQGLDESEWLAVLPVLLDKSEDLPALQEELAAIFEDRFVLAERSVRGRLIVVIVVLKRDVDEARGVLSRRGLSEVPKPGEYAGMSLGTMATLMADRLHAAPGELAGTVEELRLLGVKAGRVAKSISNRAKNETMRLRILTEMVSGHYGFGLSGWVPVRHASLQQLGSDLGCRCFLPLVVWDDRGRHRLRPCVHRDILVSHPLY